MEKIIIRKFQLIDVPCFSDLCDKDDWYYPQVSATPSVLVRYKEYRDNCFLAYDGDVLVGYVYGGILCDTLYPQFMFVKEPCRKHGIGKRLMERLEQEADCSLSMIYYHKSLRDHYKNQGYSIGTELEIAIKQLGGETL